MKRIILLVFACAAGVTACMWYGRNNNAPPPDNPFEVVMVAISGTAWMSIEYNTETGEAWSAQNGKWMKIEEEADLPSGRYVIKMTALANDWAAIRLEVKSGKAWQCRQGKWVELTKQPVLQ